ncbi:MAG TPA: STAS domain-containing protein [Bacteroidota bacterium]|nr:STAS domain-containing protein [Bacteroidota bacterium]
MELHERVEEGLKIIDLHGSFIGGMDSTKFREAIEKCLAEGHLRLLIDIGGVDYMNSTGLGSLLTGYLNVTRAGGKIVLVGGTPRVLDLLRLTKTDSTVPVAPNLAEARALVLQ